MSSLNAVVTRAMAHAVPGPIEERTLGKVARKTLSLTRSAARRQPEVVGVVLGGSFAKGTWLPGKADLDIFVKFRVGTPEGRFEAVGLGVGRVALRGHPLGKKYAQHPYTEATVDGVKVNVVPCYAVARKHWKSAADRSPFHVSVVRRLPTEQKNEIRLLKLFMISAGVYGAEIQTRGFSGYVAEVLIMNHGTFVEVLRYFAGLEPAGPGPLFALPDPVDPSRDLGVAVSGDRLATMILAARAFLSRPSTAYFGMLQQRVRSSLRGSVVAVVFAHKRLSEDILWGELRRTLKHLVGRAEREGFRVARSMAASNNSTKSAFMLIPELARLPDLEQRLGPVVTLREETRSFISQNRNRARLFWVDENARVRLLQRRENTSLEAFLKVLAKGDEGPFGASEELARAMKKSSRVVSGATLARMSESETWLNRGVRELVSDAIGTSVP